MSIRSKLHKVKRIVKNTIQASSAMNFLPLRKKIAEKILASINLIYLPEVRDFEETFSRFIEKKGASYNSTKINEMSDSANQLTNSLKGTLSS